VNNNHDYIAITSVGSISPLGSQWDEVWQSYKKKTTCIQPKDFNGEQAPVASLSIQSEQLLEGLRQENSHNKTLDKTVLMAIHCARVAAQQAQLKEREKLSTVGINIGSSRGATETLEKFHAEYLAEPKRRISPLTSPTTTLGNISSNVAHDLRAEGPTISHSVTCSTAMHAIFNGIAWMKAGFAEAFLVGGSEAPLTGFTIAQMKALRIYTKDIHSPYPCRPLSSELPHENTFALGEGAAIFVLEKARQKEIPNQKEQVLGIIESFGYAQESAATATGITENGEALQMSMAMALRNMPNNHPVDLILIHAPGTASGDASELNAIKSVFGNEMPIVISNKWLIGHTFGASAALSLEYALMILQKNDYVDFPYPAICSNKKKNIRKILINAAGFGGNATSLIVSNIFE